MKKMIRRIILIITIIAFMIALICGIYIYRVFMPTSHVYVCDYTDKYSNFDNWIKNDLGVQMVPTYLIIKDKTVIGTIDGNVTLHEFNKQYKEILKNPTHNKKLPVFKITNLDLETLSVDDIFSDNIYIFEISWIDCRECIYQDIYYTNSIYAKYSTKNIYRYYIKSDRKKVYEKYQ